MNPLFYLYRTTQGDRKKRAERTRADVGTQPYECIEKTEGLHILRHREKDAELTN